MFRSNENRSLLEVIVAVLVQVFPRVLGLMLVYTGYQKYNDHTALLAILEFDGFPASVVPTLGWIVTWTEIVLGGALILFRPARWLLAITAGLFAVFLGQLTFLLLSKDAPNYCGCELLHIVEAVQAGHRHQQRSMLMMDLFLLLAIGLTWLQLGNPRPQETPPIDVQPKENP